MNCCTNARKVPRTKTLQTNCKTFIEKLLTNAYLHHNDVRLSRWTKLICPPKKFKYKNFISIIIVICKCKRRNIAYHCSDLHNFYQDNILMLLRKQLALAMDNIRQDMSEVWEYFRCHANDGRRLVTQSMPGIRVGVYSYLPFRNSLNPSVILYNRSIDVKNINAEWIIEYAFNILND